MRLNYTINGSRESSSRSHISRMAGSEIQGRRVLERQPCMLSPIQTCASSDGSHAYVASTIVEAAVIRDVEDEEGMSVQSKKQSDAGYTGQSDFLSHKESDKPRKAGAVDQLVN